MCPHVHFPMFKSWQLCCMKPCFPQTAQETMALLSVPAGAPRRLANATGGDPLHGPVSLPHIPVRTDDTPRQAVYLIAHTGMANARVPPLAPSRNGSPGPSSPPDAGRGFSCRLVMTVPPSLKGQYQITGGPERTQTACLARSPCEPVSACGHCFRNCANAGFSVL